MKKLAYLLAVVLGSGCGRDHDVPAPALPIPAQKEASASTEPAVARAAGTSREILSRFEQDVHICKLLIEEIKNDQAFVESFVPLEARKQRSYVSFVQESSFSGKPAAQYVTLNYKYLHLGHDYHEVPWAIAWTPNDNIYCAPTFARLREIENLGDSPEAWQIREFFLDGALSSLLHPSADMTDGFIEFHELESLVQEALRLYRGPQRSSLHSWMEKAIREIEQSRKDVSEEAVLSLSEQHAELDRRIGSLRRMLSQ